MTKINRYTIKDENGTPELCGCCRKESATKTYYDELKIRIIFICKTCWNQIYYGTTNKIFS